ncbi:hypothetical protein ACGFZS_47055 [Streptomyces sp. NPDC048288]|uniref:hypothetical protein n=1 Tax=Streptomyces sp. NPDC048288 TaxID=3365529 RepID=UPI0037139A83
MTTTPETQTTNIQNPTDWSDYDFLEFEGFVHKVQWEGSYSYAVENYGPRFESSKLQAIADDPAKLRALYRENRQKVEDWRETVGGERACDLHNAHVDEERQRRQDACLWGIRCTDGYVIHYASQEDRDNSDAFLRANQGGRAKYRMPEALLHRDAPGGEWTEERPA